jgi:hypothetical protein
LRFLGTWFLFLTSWFQAAPAVKAVVKKAAPVGSGRFAISEGNAWDVEGASWAVNGGIFGRIGDGKFSDVSFLLP